MMSFKPFSKKQLAVLSFWCPSSPYNSKMGIICDGSVRSGKTLCMSISFITWSMTAFSGNRFAICGKTVTSLRRNVITPLLPLLRELGFSVTERISSNFIDIGYGKASNRYYLFGGKDESSASLIQGVTLAGILLDEVALMPRSFVEQAIARCSVEGSKFFFNCNPENPGHWFYKEWIKKASEKNTLHLRFSLTDNPSLSKAMIKRYRSLYSGAFYKRYIEGEWAASEGLVYPMFSEKNNVYSDDPKDISEYYISIDYGTVNPASFGLWGVSNGIFYRLREFYHDSKTEKYQMTDEEYYEQLCLLAGERDIKSVIVDPSAASFIECIRRHGRFTVIPADNKVNDGIRVVSDMLRSGKIKISENCSDSIREFSLYRWDENSSSDAVLKKDDHAMDDIRYFAMSMRGREYGAFAISVERR